MINRRRAKQQ